MPDPLLLFGVGSIVGIVAELVGELLHFRREP